MSETHAEHADAWSEQEAPHADAWNRPETPAVPAASGGPAVTPADAADAARLVSFGLQPKLLPARDAEYADL
ncbi:hypothetical protein ACFUGD_28170, partial [Streptomyces sp. NPDC057217]